MEENTNELKWKTIGKTFGQYYDHKIQWKGRQGYCLLCVFIKAALWQTRIVLPKIDTCHSTQAAACSPEVTTTDERDVENGWALSKCCTDGIVFTVTTSVQGDADCTTISRNAGWPCFHYCDIMKKHGPVFPLPCSKLCTTLFLLRLF
jgi:hypothetical protein